jgi:hypothetical protein
MTGYGLMIALMLVMKLAPQSPLGRWLNAGLVERPLAQLATMDRRKAMFMLILVGLTLFATDLLFVLGSYDLLTLYAWDLTMYLDVMVVASALAAVARARAGMKALVQRGSLRLRRAPRPRARRARRLARPQDRASNDDDHASDHRLAA